MRKQLTEAMVARQAPPETGRLEIFDSIVPALALRVTPTGARTYVVRGRVKGRPESIRVTVGDARGMKLSDARQQASDVLQQMRAGNDPRRGEQRDITLAELVDDWVALHLARRSERYRDEAVRAIRYAFPQLLQRPAAQITKADAVTVLDRLVRAGKTVMAGRTLAYSRAAFSWAQKRDLVPTNPFANLPIAAGGTERDRVLIDDELVKVWTATGKLGYPFGPCVRLMTLTLQREDEVAGMRWSELDLDRSLWRIPGARMKNGRAHDVHLSEPARAILRDLPHIDGCDFVFTTTGRTPISGFSKAKRRLDAMAGIDPWRLHDLRRTGVTKLAALGFDSIVVDKLLAHQPAKLRGVAGVYQRHDFARERAMALDAWAAHVTGEQVDNITPLRAAQ